MDREVELLSREEWCICFVFCVGVHAHLFTSAVRYSEFSHRITLVKVAWVDLLLA